MQYVFRDLDDQVTVAGWLARAAGHGDPQVGALGTQVIEPGPGDQVTVWSAESGADVPASLIAAGAAGS